MLVILFLMEFARGMYVLSYVNYLPTVTSIAVAVTSVALSIHFISDAACLLYTSPSPRDS